MPDEVARIGALSNGSNGQRSLESASLHFAAFWRRLSEAHLRGVASRNLEPKPKDPVREFSRTGVRVRSPNLTLSLPRKGSASAMSTFAGKQMLYQATFPEQRTSRCYVFVIRASSTRWWRATKTIQ
jgi:hypothetical protein